MSQQQQSKPGRSEPGRRPPRFSAFLSTGAVIGLLVGFLLGAIAPPDERYDPAATWGFLGLVCACLGLLLGGVVAVLVDRRS